MRKLLTCAVLTLGLLGLTAGRATAQTIGPVCMKPSTFNDTFVLIYNFHGPNHLVGTGRNLTTGSAVTSTAVFSGNNVVIGILSPLPPSGAAHSAQFSASLSLASFSGPGRCEAINTGLGCGTSASFTMSLVSCPANALSDEG